MNPVKPPASVALQLYTLRDYTRTPSDVAITLERAAKMGYGAVQVSGTGEIEPSRLREILDSNGLTCCATHENLPSLLNNFDSILRKLKTLGCGMTFLGYPGDGFWSAEGMKKLSLDLDSLGKKFRDNGVVFGYHNHDRELEKYDGDRTGLDILFGTAKPENLAAELDTYWIAFAGADPAAWITKLAGRVPLIHLKDLKKKEGKNVMAELGEGILDWDAILAACKKAGVRWYAVEQDDCERDPFVSVEMSLKFLQSRGFR